MSDLLDEELGGSARTRIVRHLARCEHCRALLASLGRTLEQLRSLGDADRPTPAPSTVTTVLAHIRRDER